MSHRLLKRLRLVLATPLPSIASYGNLQYTEYTALAKFLGALKGFYLIVFFHFCALCFPPAELRDRGRICRARTPLASDVTILGYWAGSLPKVLNEVRDVPVM
jgi:hypothetical protein